MSITTNVKHRVRTTGLEHQGQTSISDPDQNLGFTCIFSSGMEESIYLSTQKDLSYLHKNVMLWKLVERTILISSHNKDFYGELRNIMIKLLIQ